MPDSQLLPDYRRDGVAVVKVLLSDAELREVRARIDEYERERLPELPSGDYTLEPDGHTVRNLWRLEQHDSFFAEFAARPRLLELVTPLLNGPPVLLGVETFNKPAKVGSRVPPHQDNAYFCQSPPDVVTVWIAIDAATVENGAVNYLLRSHQALRPHQPSGVKGNSFGLVDFPEGEFRQLVGEIRPGDALLHHCQTIHFSEPNLSNQSRLSLILVYRGEHTLTDPQLKEAYLQAVTLTPP